MKTVLFNLRLGEVVITLPLVVLCFDTIMASGPRAYPDQGRDLIGRVAAALTDEHGRG